MTVLVHFSGPSYSKTVVLEPGGAPVDVGRDPQAGIHLPDNDRLISRRHITIEWCEGGVRVSVLSKVNGLTTPRGEFSIGQSVVLAPGETGQLGRYSLVVERPAASAAAAAPRAAGAPADDPFALLGLGPAAAGGAPPTVFDDPFFRPTPKPTAPSINTSAALEAMSSKPGLGGAGFSGGASSPGYDPLAAFGGNQPPVHSSVSIDEFLGTPSAAPVGLGAAQLLKAQPQEPARRLASDHVHDFNLPVRPMSVQAMPFPSMPPSMPPAAPPTEPPAPAAAAAAKPAAGKSDDPWGDLNDWAPTAKKKPAFQPSSAGSLNHAFDDAFSSSTAWRVEDMPSVDPLASGSFENDSVLGAAFSMPDKPAAAAAGGQNNEAALRALCKGLGISVPPQLGEKDWEQLGHSIRQIVQGLADLMNVRAELKKEMRAADRTMLGAQENNPLKSGIPLEELLHYLLFMPQGAAGYMPVKKALDESITDLRAHEFASLAAVRAVVEGSIKEFEPGKLRTTLMKGKRSFATVVDNARLWDLYTAHYEHKGQHMADWLEQVFNRHFMPAYSREAERLRKESLPQPPVNPRRA